MSPVNSVISPILVELGVHLDDLQYQSAETDYLLIAESQAILKNFDRRTSSNHSHSESEDVEKTQIGDLLVPKLLALVRSCDSEELNSKILGLLEVVLLMFKFETILARYVSMDIINEGMESSVEDLVVLTIRIVGHTEPADLIASTPLINTMVNVLKNPETSTRVTSEVFRALDYLSTNGELIRRRLKSKEILNSLREMRYADKYGAVMKSRLLELILVLSESMKEDIPVDLYVFDLKEPRVSKDVIFLVYLIHFYATMIPVIAEYRSMHSILPRLSATFDYITRLYVEDDSTSDFKLFKKTPASFLVTLAKHFPEVFKDLASKHGIFEITELTYLSEDASMYLLTAISPSILREMTSTDFLQQIPLNSKTLGIYENLISEKESFESFTILTPSKLQSLQVIDFLDFLTCMSSSWHSCEKLLLEYPGAMYRLLDEEANVLNPEVRRFKIIVLENMLKFKGDLGIWEAKVSESYRSITQGRSLEPQVGVIGSSI